MSQQLSLSDGASEENLLSAAPVPAPELPLAPAPWLLTRQPSCPLMRLLLGGALAVVAP